MSAARPVYTPHDGQSVTCPEDRGDPAYRGIVTSADDEVRKNHQGYPYVWVSVRNPNTGRTSVWPSNRLKE